MLSYFVRIIMTVLDADGKAKTVTLIDRMKDGGVVLDGTERLTWEEFAAKLYFGGWKLP